VSLWLCHINQLGIWKPAKPFPCTIYQLPGCSTFHKRLLWCHCLLRVGREHWQRRYWNVMAQFKLWRPYLSKGGEIVGFVDLLHSAEGGASRGELDSIRKSSLAARSCLKLQLPWPLLWALTTAYREVPSLGSTSRHRQADTKPSQPRPSRTMAPTPIQENLVESNKKYASSFTQGHLALPPAKKYAVCTDPSLLSTPSQSHWHLAVQWPVWTPVSTPHLLMELLSVTPT
jgi:hypothetical protein